MFPHEATKLIECQTNDDDEGTKFAVEISTALWLVTEKGVVFCFWDIMRYESALVRWG